MRSRYVLLGLLVLSVASACRPRAAAPDAATPDSRLISPLSIMMLQSPLDQPASQEQGISALASFGVAQERAKQWSGESVWHGIAPVTMMEKNLGIPTTGRGWFFRFGQKGNTLELYVLVDGLEIRGATEAQPILVEPLPYELLAISPKDIALDSPQVLEVFRANGGQAYLDGHPDARLDYRLVHVKGTPNAVWSLFDVGDLTIPLINVDAKTGGVVGDPFGSH